MTENRPGPSKVRVSDKRRLLEDAAGSGAPATEEGSDNNESDERADNPSRDAQSETEARADHPSGSHVATVGEHDYLDDLKRLQAEFDNYRKRAIREQTELAGRAGARLVERLLPVLDNFDRALEHTNDDGMVLVHKELISVLESEGLATIEALGAPFDPNLHEAVESHEDEGVSEPTVVMVYRTGYEFKGRVLRPAMVVVARPAEVTTEDPAESEGN